jgi:ankyrin repeat protein
MNYPTANILWRSTLLLFLLFSTRAVFSQPPTQHPIVSAALACNAAEIKTLVAQQPQLLAIRNEAEWGKPWLLEVVAKCEDLATARFLIDKKADVNALDDNGFSPLRYAVGANNLPLIELLLAKKANPNRPDNFGVTPLFTQNAAIVKTLLDHGANPNVVDREGRTVLHYYPQRELVPLFAAKHFNFNAKDKNEKTPLHLATQGAAAFCAEQRNRGYSMSTAGFEDVRALVEAGSDVNAHDGEGATPLMLGSNYEELATFLLSKGADIKAQDLYTGTILHRMIREPFPAPGPRYRDPHRMLPPACGLDLEPLKKLEFYLSRGVPLAARDRNGGTVLATLLTRPNSQDLVPDVDDKGNTLLHLATTGKNMSVAEFLLQQGVSPNKQNAAGETPLHLVPDVKFAELLLKYKANPWYVDEHLQSPLYNAVNLDSVELLRLLLSVRRNEADLWGTPLLHLAAMRGNAQIMEALVKAGIPVNLRRGNQLQQPIHLAAEYPTPRTLENLKYLLANGAEIDARDKDNHSALYLTVTDEPTVAKFEAAKLLLEKGADSSFRDSSDRAPLDAAREQRKSYDYRFAADPELVKGSDEVIALLEKTTGDVPLRRIFGETRLPDGTLVNATVIFKDASESQARLGLVEITAGGKFELKLREGQQFVVFAFYNRVANGRKFYHYTGAARSLQVIHTVKGDTGPLLITLDGVNPKQ